MTKFTITQGALKSAIKAVFPVLEKHNTIPILSSILFGHGFVRGTDLDMEITASLGLHGKIERPFAVDARQIRSMAMHIPEDELVTIDSPEWSSGIDVTFNGGEYGLTGYNPNDFPILMKSVEFGKTEGSEMAGICAAMRRVQFAISTEETRYYLNGVAFALDRTNTPAVVATDGHRLAMARISFMPRGANGTIVPRKAVKLLTGIQHEPNRIAFSLGTSAAQAVCAEFDGLVIKSKCIDGTYPDFNRVIPEAPKKRAIFNRAKLLTVLRRMSAARGERNRGVRLTISPEKCVFSIASTHEMKGIERFSAYSALAAEPFEIGFNISYFIQTLAALSGDEVTFSTDGAASPSVFTDDRDDLLVVMMPMRV